MKKILITTILACAGAAVLTPAAQAATATYNAGDLLLGFRADNGTQDYVLDIGQASLYTKQNGASINVTSTTVNGVQLAPIAGDLNTVFGSTYPSGSGGNFVHFSLSGTDLGTDPGNTLYISKPEVTIGTPVTGFPRQNGSSQSGTNSQMETFASGYQGLFQQSGSYTLTASGGEIQGAADQNNYPSFNPPAESTSFGAFSGSEGIFNNGTAGTALDLFRLVPGTTGTGGTVGTPGTYEGRLTINNAGVVTFQSVPEPGSFALLSAGAACCGFIRRRKSLLA